MITKQVIGSIKTLVVEKYFLFTAVQKKLASENLWLKAQIRKSKSCFNTSTTRSFNMKRFGINLLRNSELGFYRYCYCELNSYFYKMELFF